MEDIDEKKKSCVDSMRKDFDTRKGELVIASEKRISDLRDLYDRKVKEATNALRARESSITDLEEKRIVLEKRNHLIEESLNSLEDSLSVLKESKEYREILSSMTVLAKKMLGDKAVFYLSPEDLKTEGKEIEAKKLSRPLHIPGGLVATSPDGKMEVDLTFDTIFREIREDLSLELENRIKEA